jgi:hypothetical protein
MKFIGNEKSLGIFFFKETEICKWGEASLIETHEFYFEEKNKLNQENMLGEPLRNAFCSK